MVIPIEVVARTPFANCHDSREHGPNSSPWRVEATFLDETHHQQYGRPWALGNYILEFAISSGLRPEHRLLDFGCGALRFGGRAIAYLNPGNYFGVDKHLSSLEAATSYEIPLHELELKRPRLLWDDGFGFSHFGTCFDWVIDFSSSSKLELETFPQLLSSFLEVMAPGGRLVTGPQLPAAIQAYVASGFTLVRGPEVQHCPLLEGHEFPSTNTWWEFARTSSDGM